MSELGDGSGSGYPAALDTDATLETGADFARIGVPNDLAAAIVKIETELGTDPAGVAADPTGAYTDVKTRLNKLPRVMKTDVAAVGNVDAGEDDLISYSLVAATLGTVNDAVRIKAWGSTAANANSKTIKLKFGATTLMSVTAPVNAGVWTIDALVVRTAAATQDAWAEYRDDIPNGEQTLSAPTETLSGAITIKCTGEGTATNDIVQEGMMVEYLPAP